MSYDVYLAIYEALAKESSILRLLELTRSERTQQAGRAERTEETLAAAAANERGTPVFVEGFLSKAVRRRRPRRRIQSAVHHSGHRDRCSLRTCPSGRPSARDLEKRPRRRQRLVSSAARQQQQQQGPPGQRPRSTAWAQQVRPAIPASKPVAWPPKVKARLEKLALTFMFFWQA